MDSLAPNIFVKDITSTISFYEQLGFSLTMSVPAQGEGDTVWAMMTNGNVTMMFQTFESLADTLPAISRQDGGSLLFYIRVPRIRAFFEEIKDKVFLVQACKRPSTALRNFHYDNNNYVLTFAEDEGK